MAWIASLWASSSFWEGIEYIAEAIVITGALFEFLADFEHILKGDEKKELRKRVEKLAAIGLIVGLAVGLGALVRTNHLFTDTIASLYVEARDAGKSAKTASDRATLAIGRNEQLEIEAQTLRERTEHEIEARLALEKHLVWQGPRDVPILAAQNLFDRRLRRFAGQRFRTSVCTLDMDNNGTSEVLLTENALYGSLTHAGLVGLPSYPQTPPFVPLMINNCRSNAVRVTIGSEASDETRRAAEALASVINKVLAEHKHPSVGRPTLGAPNQLPPDVIEIHVGRHLPHPFDMQ